MDSPSAATSRTTLVTGATGLVGRQLVRVLGDAGQRVRIVSRREKPDGFAAHVEARTWDGSHFSAEVLSGVDAVVHLAGEPIFGGPLSAARKERVRASRIDSTRSLVEAIAALPPTERPSCLVCASAIGYYGSRDDTPLTEEADAGEGFLADVCADWEAAAVGAEALGLRVVRLRIAVVMSAEGGALPQLSLPFRFGLGGRLGDGAQWFSWIHLDDLVSMIHRALENEAWRGAINAAAPEPVTNAELTRILGRILSRPTFMRVPAFALRLVLGELSGELLGSRRVLPAAAEARGFRFKHESIESALREELG